jgi:hypothetical protein
VIKLKLKEFINIHVKPSEKIYLYTLKGHGSSDFNLVFGNHAISIPEHYLESEEWTILGSSHIDGGIKIRLHDVKEPPQKRYSYEIYMGNERRNGVVEVSPDATPEQIKAEVLDDCCFGTYKIEEVI